MTRRGEGGWLVLGIVCGPMMVYLAVVLNKQAQKMDNHKRLSESHDS